MMNEKEMIEQSILAQRVYLDIMRRRHLAWANSTSDSEIKRGHVEIAELIQHTCEQYYDLLNTYHDFAGERVSEVR